MKGAISYRIYIVSALLLFFLITIIARLFTLQIIHHEKLSEEATHQYVSETVNSFDRGSIRIFDNQAPYTVATLKRGFTLAINPKEVTDPEGTYEKMAAILPLDRNQYFEKLKHTDDPYEVLAERLEPVVGDAIHDKHLGGVIVAPTEWRFYPGETLAAHVVGFVGFSGDSIVGRTGLERQYEEVLSKTSAPLSTNFFTDLFSAGKDVVTGEVPMQGSVESTIDVEIQTFLEKELAETQKKWRSKKTLGIIMDPKTGEILALAINPTFNPNTYNKETNPGIFSNTAIESVYEMGSVIKVLTVAAGIDSKSVTMETTYTDTGSETIDDYTIRNFDGKARGIVPVSEVLRQSLNIGAAHVAREMGYSVMRNYFIDKYKLGEETGIDLPSEAHGLLDNLDADSRIEFATASFGQGIALTPIATIRALAVVANGGYLVDPYITKKILYPGGIVKSTVPTNPPVKVLSEETSKEVARVLVSVVDEKLGEGKFKISSTSVAAKTGTAQIPSPNGGYYTDRYNHTFFGYFPAYDPKYIIFLMNFEPQGAQYSSETLAQPFSDIVSFLINYGNIAPDR